MSEHHLTRPCSSAGRAYPIQGYEFEFRRSWLNISQFRGILGQINQCERYASRPLPISYSLIQYLNRSFLNIKTFSQQSAENLNKTFIKKFLVNYSGFLAFANSTWLIDLPVFPSSELFQSTDSITSWQASFDSSNLLAKQLVYCSRGGYSNITQANKTLCSMCAKQCNRFGQYEVVTCFYLNAVSWIAIPLNRGCIEKKTPVYETTDPNGYTH